MKPEHPFAIVAPWLALAAFAATALVSLVRGADTLGLVIRSVAVFLFVYYFCRGCAHVLAGLPTPSPADRSGNKPGEEGE